MMSERRIEVPIKVDGSVDGITGRWEGLSVEEQARIKSGLEELGRAWTAVVEGFVRSVEGALRDLGPLLEQAAEEFRQVCQGCPTFCGCFLCVDKPCRSCYESCTHPGVINHESR